MNPKRIRVLKIAGLVMGALYAIPGLSGCGQVFQANIEALLRPEVIQTGFFYPFTLIGRLFGS